LADRSRRTMTLMLAWDTKKNPFSKNENKEKRKIKERKFKFRMSPQTN
jgi:hypothetical protein